MTSDAPILILGGTEDAAELAHELNDQGCDVVLSLAGLTKAPSPVASRSRVGGFGGVTGLVAELQQGGYRLLVDATHPFAAQMASNAHTAAGAASVPYLRLLRAPWRAGPGDQWNEVDDLSAAALDVGRRDVQRAFLAIGSRELGLFARLGDVQFLVRAIELPLTVPENMTVVLARGPFTVGDEIALLEDRRIELMVTRNSGARATEAKLEASRQLGIPVVMVRRPAATSGEQVTTVREALDRIDALLSRA